HLIAAIVGGAAELPLLRVEVEHAFLHVRVVVPLTIEIVGELVELLGRVLRAAAGDENQQKDLTHSATPTAWRRCRREFSGESARAPRWPYRPWPVRWPGDTRASRCRRRCGRRARARSSRESAPPTDRRSPATRSRSCTPAPAPLRSAT